MRNVMFTLLALSVVLALAGCGGGEVKPDAKAAMEKNKMVRIATDAVNMPFEFGSGPGVQGLHIDLGEEIGKDLGYQVKWIKFPFDRTFDLLKNGEVELIISAVAVTPERQKGFVFSEPYFATTNDIARRRDKPEIKDLASLSGKLVGVQSSRTGDAFMTTQKTAANVQIEKFKTLDDALGALNRTEVYAVVGDQPILTYSIYKSFPNLITTGSQLSNIQYAVVVRKDEKELLSKVNQTIARLRSSGALDQMRAKWFQNVMESTSQERKKLEEEEALKNSPKAVTFHFNKLSSSNFSMDRLDGYQLVLVGESGTFKSDYILTNGNHGSCKFPQAIPPGEYRLDMSIFRLTTTIKIPKAAKKSITFDMNIGKGIDIRERG